MSKIAVSGNASGTGTFTIQSPATNTDRVLTLPDEAGTVLTSASSIPVANLDSAVGITHADHWAINTSASYSSGTTDLTSNWQQANWDSAGSIGTAMSESSGIFTFPVTGIWKIEFQYMCTATAASNYHGGYIVVSTNGGANFSAASQALNGAIGSSSYISTYTSFVLDVTSTTAVKVKFQIENQVGGTIDAATTVSRTSATFIRLGDT